jgi:hypothetical protein
MFIKPSFEVVGHSNVNIVSVVAFYSVNSDFKRTQTFHASTNPACRQAGSPPGQWRANIRQKGK